MQFVSLLVWKQMTECRLQWGMNRERNSFTVQWCHVNFHTHPLTFKPSLDKSPSLSSVLSTPLISTHTRTHPPTHKDKNPNHPYTFWPFCNLSPSLLFHHLFSQLPTSMPNHSNTQIPRTHIHTHIHTIHTVNVKLATLNACSCLRHTVQPSPLGAMHGGKDASRVKWLKAAKGQKAWIQKMLERKIKKP